MAAKRINVSMPESLLDEAQLLMKSKHYDSISEYVADLIRQDAKANRQPSVLQDSPVTSFGNGSKKHSA